MIAGQAGVADRGLEREELLVAQLARPDVHGRLVQAALGHAVTDHVLAGGQDPVGEDRRPGARGCRRTRGGGQVRVLAVGLLDPAPARVAGDVEDRRQRVARARSASIRRRIVVAIASTSSGSQVAAAPIDCWKTGASRESRPCSDLLVDDRRDAQPGLLPR